MGGRAQFPQLADAEWLRVQYVELERSCPEIAGHLGCSSSLVELRLKDFGIPRRSRNSPVNRRRLRPKACEGCGEKYQPVGPAQRLCDRCWAREDQVCADCGVAFRLDYVPGRRGNRGWVASYCPPCRAARKGAPRRELGESRAAELATSGEFACRDCGGTFPLSEGIRDSSRRSGYMERCKECEGARMAEYRADPVLQAVQRRRQRECNYRRFGASVADYDRLLIEQDGRCAICGHLPAEGGQILYFDHHHAEARPRGLLCHHCNAGLGHFADNPGRLHAAVAYLEKHAREGSAVGVDQLAAS